MYLSRQDASQSLRDKVSERVQACERRISELDMMLRNPQPVSAQPTAGGQAQAPRPPGGGGGRPAASGGGSGGGRSGGGGGNDTESSEARDKMSSAIMIERPNIHWDDVAGLGEAKRNLIQAVILPMKLPQFFTGPRTPWRGILLYGPPGTGKSFLAKACATEAEGAAFLTVSTSDLVSKWMGESEKLIRALFETARAQGKAVIFIDEIDSLLSERSEHDSEAGRRIKTEFLIQMDGVGKSMDGILLLAATNIPWGLDPAVRRRFEKKIYIPLPDKEARLALLKLKTKGMPSKITEEQFEYLAQLTEGYSGADINILCRDAAMAPVNKIQQAEWFVPFDGLLWPCNPGYPNSFQARVLDMTPEQLKMLKPLDLCYEDFQTALTKTRPSVAPSDLQRFEAWTAEFGQEGN
jgi:vacuolar protein-sorting-associated protein 4